MVPIERLASLDTYNLVDQQNEEVAVGLEINADHLRSKSEEMVTATNTLLHKGCKPTVTGYTRLADEEGKLVCVSPRCTVVPKTGSRGHDFSHYAAHSKASLSVTSRTPADLSSYRQWQTGASSLAKIYR